MNRSAVAGIVLAFVALSHPAFADPFTINVLQATHTVSLSTKTWPGTTSAATTTLNTRVSDAMLDDGLVYRSFGSLDGGTSNIDGASAFADLFEVSSWTNTEHFSDFRQAAAVATTDLTFMPLFTGTALIDLTFLLGGDAAAFTGSMVRVVDLTTSLEVWAVGWPFFIGYPMGQFLSSAPTTIATQFDSSHLYQLSLSAQTNSSVDFQTVTARVGGLQSVPEPSTLLLIGIGGGIAAIKRRRGIRS